MCAMGGSHAFGLGDLEFRHDSGRERLQSDYGRLERVSTDVDVERDVDILGNSGRSGESQRTREVPRRRFEN